MESQQTELKRVEGALVFIPSDCSRNYWVKMLMGIKSEFGEAGRDLAERWSEKADSYNKKDFNDTWRSIKEDGGVNIGTVFFEAEQNGWTDDSKRKPTPPTPEEITQRDAKRKAADDEQKARREAAATRALVIWNEAPPRPADHPYLKRKGIPSHGARIYHGNLIINETRCNGALLVPMYLNRKITGLQFISEEGKKLFLPGMEKGYYMIGKAEPGKPVCICEGFATGATIHEATGYTVIVAFDAGNLCKMALAFRAKNPDAMIILCADDDVSKTGQRKAEEAARTVGGFLALPEFGESLADDASDFNDMAKHCGPEAVRRVIDAAMPVNQNSGPVGSVLSGLILSDDTNTAAATGGGIAGASDGEYVRNVNLVRGSDIKPVAITWIWPDWLARGKFHVLGGAPGAGKTTISMGLAATVTIGGRWPDGTRATVGNVVIWSGEDDPKDTLAPRLILSGADMSRVYFISSIQDGTEERSFDPARDMEPLQRKLEEIGEVQLLIVDPIVSAITGDSHKNAEVRRGLQPLADMAASIGCALLGITHFSKGTSGSDPVNRLTGSLAFGAMARGVLVATKHQEEGENGKAKRIFCRAKSNIGLDSGGFEYDLHQSELKSHPGIFVSSVQWGDPLEGTARELLATADVTGDDGEGGTLADAKRFLAGLLAECPKPVKDIKADAEGAGYSWATIRRAQKALKIDAIKESMKGPWKWQMPQHETMKTFSGARRCSENTEDAQ